jgi:hypothetical protein
MSHNQSAKVGQVHETVRLVPCFVPIMFAVFYSFCGVYIYIYIPLIIDDSGKNIVYF